MTKTIAIVITGEVQKVNFRRSAQQQAMQLGISGTVQNIGDNTVHIEASGPPDQIDLFIEWCRKGPEKAVVANLQVNKISQRNFSGFTVIRNRK